MKSLQELVDWNRAHAHEALTEGMVFWRKLHSILLIKREYPFQDLLEEGLAFGDSQEAREKPLAHANAVATNFDEMIEEHKLDVIIASGDCMLSTYAAAGGKLKFQIFDSNTSNRGMHVESVDRLLGSRVSYWNFASWLPRSQWQTGWFVDCSTSFQGITILKFMDLWETTFSPRREHIEFLKHSVSA